MSEKTSSHFFNTLGSKAGLSKSVVRGVSPEGEAMLESAEYHPSMIRGALADSYTLSTTMNTFPDKVVIDLSEPIRALYADKVLGNYISQFLLISCLDAVAFSLNQKYDFFDHIGISVEAAVIECLDDAATNGNLPQGEEDESGEDIVLNENLNEHVMNFCLQVRSALMAQSLPCLEWVGMPYVVLGIKSTGNVTFFKKGTDEILQLVFG